MPLRGQEEVLKAFDLERRRLLYRLEKNVMAMANYLLFAIGVNSSLTDHTLADLADMGHPYAKRNPNPPHDPWWLIHRQSGALLESLEMDNPDPGHYRIGFDEHKAKHVPYVLLGTRTMIARDVLNETVRSEREELVRMVGKDLQVMSGHYGRRRRCSVNTSST